MNTTSPHITKPVQLAPKTLALIQALAESQYGDSFTHIGYTPEKMLARLIHDDAARAGIQVPCLRASAREAVIGMAQEAFEKNLDESAGYWRLFVESDGSVGWGHASSKSEYGEGEIVLMKGVGCNGCSNGLKKEDYLDENGRFVSVSEKHIGTDADYMQDALQILENIREGWFDDEAELIRA